MRTLFVSLLVLASSLTGLALPASASAAPVATGSLEWGFTDSFRSYIATGGTMTATDGATTADATPTSPFLWPTESASYDAATGVGDVQFAGTVRFQYPGHGIDLSVSRPRAVFTGDTLADLYWTGPTGTVLGSKLSGVTISAGVLESTSAVFTTAGGAPFTYGAGTALDNVRFAMSVPLAPLGTLAWGIKQSFNDYVTGPIAHGSIALSGVTQSSAGYVFPGVTADATGATYSGAVHFTGHGGLLDITLSNPELRVIDASRATLYVSVDGGTPVDFAAVDLGSAARTDAAASVAWTNAPAALTASGAAVFSVGGYVEGTELDPVTATVAYPGSQWPVSSAPPIVKAAKTSLALGANPTSLTAGDSTTLTAIVKPAAAGTVSFSEGSKSLGSVATADTASVKVTKLTARSHTYTATFTPSDPTAFTSSISSATVVVDAKTVTVGSLRWGIKQSFRDYVTGPIAQGAISTTGVTTLGGAFVFPQSSSDNPTYSGAVRFIGHAGALDLSFSDPSVTVTSASSAALSIGVSGRGRVVIATLDLAGAVKSEPGSAVRYAGAPASLTASGASVFSLDGSSFYAVGTALDPVTFVIGSASGEAAPPAKTVSTFDRGNVAAPEAPATTGIDTGDSTFVDGGEVTISASGFQPHEKNVLVVAYSTPVTLATDAAANAAGIVTWTGHLPAGLTGSHTLTLQGSVDRGVVIDIEAAAQTAVSQCPVTDAALTWGFKESFRSYISGSIAKGKWSVAGGATYATPNFGWSTGTGSYDQGAGEIEFAGSIDFTGHGGLLNTTVANPSLRFDSATSATMLLDVSGETQQGSRVDQKAVEFVTLDLSKATVTNLNGVTTITKAPAVLTSAGAAAFGTYETGEEFDPVTVSFTSACAAPAVAAVPTATPTIVPAVADEPTAFPWLTLVLAIVVLLLLAVIVVLVVRRRQGA